jgi:hypothetical protein
MKLFLKCEKPNGLYSPHSWPGCTPSWWLRRWRGCSQHLQIWTSHSLQDVGWSGHQQAATNESFLETTATNTVKVRFIALNQFSENASGLQSIKKTYLRAQCPCCVMCLPQDLVVWPEVCAPTLVHRKILSFTHLQPQIKKFCKNDWYQI